jgi:hypothetical protein
VWLSVSWLAELLIESSLGNGPAKRRLRPEFADAARAKDVAREVFGLATIERSLSLIDCQQRKELVNDLET